MKKRFCLALGMALCLAACDSKEEPAAKTAPAAETAKEAPAAKTAENTNDANDLNKLLEGVEISPKGISSVYKNKPFNEHKQLDFILLTHESPIVRAYVYNRMTRNYSKGDAELETFVKQLQGEKDPTVLAAGIKSLMNDLKSSEELYKLVLEAGKHEDAQVRNKVAFALSNSNNKSVEGIYDEAFKFLSDSDENVRKTVCKNLPDYGNETIIPELVKVLNSKEEKDLAIAGDCLEGLISMWYDWPLFKNHSENAYKETLKYFNKKPRGKNSPHWFGFTSLQYGYNDASAEWKEASSYMKPEKIAAAMTDIVKDSNAEWLARKTAVTVIGTFGTKKDLEKLDAVFTDTTNFDVNSIKKSIAEAIAKKQ